MRTRAAAILLWVAATVAATLLVSAGVGAIRDTTRADEPLTRPPATTMDAVPTTGDASTDGASPTTTSRAQSSTTTPPSTTSPTAPPTVPPPVPPATSPPTVPPPTVPPPTTAAPAVDPVTLTIPSEGGSATIRFAPDSVSVLAATPAPGYAAKVSPQGSTAVRVEFEDGDRRSRIDATWDGGPVSEVRED